jgi:hypothetical protein
MSAGTVSRLLSLIPQRTGRTQSGVLFQAEASRCTYPERLCQLSKFLTWLRPLDALTREEQVALGLIAPNGRPVQAADDDDGEDIELEAEESVGHPAPALAH